MKKDLSALAVVFSLAGCFEVGQERVEPPKDRPVQITSAAPESVDPVDTEPATSTLANEPLDFAAITPGNKLNIIGNKMFGVGECKEILLQRTESPEVALSLEVWVSGPRVLYQDSDCTAPASRISVLSGETEVSLYMKSTERSVSRYTLKTFSNEFSVSFFAEASDKPVVDTTVAPVGGINLAIQGNKEFRVGECRAISIHRTDNAVTPLELEVWRSGKLTLFKDPKCTSVAWNASMLSSERSLDLYVKSSEKDVSEFTIKTFSGSSMVKFATQFRE